MTFKTISVVGLGYIGLPTAAVLAKNKVNVVGVDIAQSVVDTINRGEIHIVEPDLQQIVQESVDQGYLVATTTPHPADAFLIAVPTPFKDSTSNIPEPDISYIERAVEAIAPVLKKGDLVILESTSPVGTTERVAALIASLCSEFNVPTISPNEPDIHIAYCPERVLPGHVIKELEENDRVIGGLTPSCSAKAASLYSLFVKGECVHTDARTAEMSKLTENACRDVQIAFANELSMVCDTMGINVWELISLANRHPRINILQPGPGVGGHCIAVDPWFIISACPSNAAMMHEARKVNLAKTDWVVDKVKTQIALFTDQHNDQQPKIAFFGIAFKANIDDTRQSPALEVVQKIIVTNCCDCYVVEPNISGLPNLNAKLIDMHTAFEQCDILVLLVEHQEFLSLDIPNTKVVIDTKGIW